MCVCQQRLNVVAMNIICFMRVQRKEGENKQTKKKKKTHDISTVIPEVSEHIKGSHLIRARYKRLYHRRWTAKGQCHRGTPGTCVYNVVPKLGLVVVGSLV